MSDLKKILAMGMALSLLLGLTACGAAVEESASPAEEVVSEAAGAESTASQTAEETPSPAVEPAAAEG